MNPEDDSDEEINRPTFFEPLPIIPPEIIDNEFDEFINNYSDSDIERIENLNVEDINLDWFNNRFIDTPVNSQPRSRSSTEPIYTSPVNSQPRSRADSNEKDSGNNKSVKKRRRNLVKKSKSRKQKFVKKSKSKRRKSVKKKKSKRKL